MNINLITDLYESGLSIKKVAYKTGYKKSQVWKILSSQKKIRSKQEAQLVRYGRPVCRTVQKYKFKSYCYSTEYGAKKAQEKINAMMGLPLREGFHIMRVFEENGFWYLSRSL